MLISKKKLERAKMLLSEGDIESMKKYMLVSELNEFGVSIYIGTYLDADALKKILKVVVSNIVDRN